MFVPSRSVAKAAIVSHRLAYPVLSDPELTLGQALGLPTFEHAGRQRYHRLLLLVRNEIIEWALYPITTPSSTPTQVLTWLQLNDRRGPLTRELEVLRHVSKGRTRPQIGRTSTETARRIKILLDVWDSTSLDGQQRVIGREKLSGAPLGSRSEYDPVNLQAHNGSGEPLIPADAHIRLTSPQSNSGHRILRRGYSYSEAIEPGSGQLDAGLFFIAFQRSPARQFIPLQRLLAANDALNRHTVHTSSAVFFCPPGAKPGGFIGESLFS